MRIRNHDVFSDIKIIDLFDSRDERGSFTKLFHSGLFLQGELNVEIQEVYYSVSQKDVIRGLHFQLPPSEHEKIVHVISGKVIDVIVDLRKNSSTYKEYITIDLNGEQKKAVYIPKGFAHGFKSMEDGTIMQYCVSKVYDAEADSGIRYDSIGFNWKTDTPILSERDKSFVSLEMFESPF